jgi:hypothetical protein
VYHDLDSCATSAVGKLHAKITATARDIEDTDGLNGSLASDVRYRTPQIIRGETPRIDTPQPSECALMFDGIEVGLVHSLGKNSSRKHVVRGANGMIG